MRHLNYNHLLYFWTVAREGSIAKAADVLCLAPQTISGQLKVLEDVLGNPLFHRVGRRLALSETGHIVKQYADEIFSLGAELTQRMKNPEPGAPSVLNIGIVNSIAKLITYRIIRPALELEDELRVVCLEGDVNKLLADLAVHKLDLLVSDRPLPPGLSVKAYNHVLGESGVGFFSCARGAASLRRKFPQSIADTGLLLPVRSNPLRQRLDDWFEQIAIRPRVIAEFDDSALMKAFAAAPDTMFPAPLAIESNLKQTYGARLIGAVDGVVETYYAISPERKIKHPAVLAITQVARTQLLQV